MSELLLLGQTLASRGNPFVEGPDAMEHRRRGGVLVRDGLISAVDEADRLKTAHPDAPIVDHGEGLILPGFIDAHVHYPQTGIIASWGKRLIDWLNTYTFPEEARFSDPQVAAEIAARHLDLALAHGTTTAASFCTIHPASVDAFFEAAAARGMAAVAGKTCMDRNAPENLRDTAQSAYDDSKALIARWHGNGRARYAITPRFSPTSTREQLAALGALWSEHPGCLMQTHLSEQPEEIAWVMDLFPEARDYLATYEAAGLFGPGGIYGHAIHLTDRERARIEEADASIAHCPTSNAFIGSGLFDLALAATHRVGLATDTGGGSSFSMLRTMASAYEIGQLRGRPAHPSELLWLATEGSARALRREGEIGRLAAGAAADICVLDLTSTPAIAQRAVRAADIWEAVFPTIMMGDDRAVSAVYVAGRDMTRR